MPPAPAQGRPLPLRGCLGYPPGADPVPNLSGAGDSWCRLRWSPSRPPPPPPRPGAGRGSGRSCRWSQFRTPRAPDHRARAPRSHVAAPVPGPGAARRRGCGSAPRRSPPGSAEQPPGGCPGGATPRRDRRCSGAGCGASRSATARPGVPAAGHLHRTAAEQPDRPASPAGGSSVARSGCSPPAAPR